ncbi:MAG: hypothetical protein EB830_01695 [Nitrosopumilus sp. H13]|nr:MAG: hypothetical protein EB830_01695 [Nitrosopumilus sp. H13]
MYLVRNRAVKVYCDRCDSVFGSRVEFDKHASRHRDVMQEACPIDTALSKLAGALRRLIR